MSHDMFGAPNQTYYINGRNYQADATGKITNVADAADRQALRAADCVYEDPVVAAASGGGVGAVLSVAGRTGAVMLSHSDVSGLGSAAMAATTDFDAAGSAPVQSVAGRTGAVTLSHSDVSGLGSAALVATTAFDAAGAAAAAEVAAKAYADAGDASAIDTTLATTDATANVVAASYTPAHNTLIHVEATFFSRFQSGTDGKTHKVTASFLTDNSGAVTIVGSALGGDTHTTTGATNAASNVQTNGTVVQLVITGIAATNINWRVIGDITVST